VRDDQTEELECGGDTGCRESFVRYHEMLFLEHTNKAECARRRGLKLGMNDEIYSEVGGDSKAAYLNDARLLAHCQVPSSADLAQQLTDHAMATNLRRWQHVFGADNIMCLHNTDLARNPQHARRVAANFIGAPEPELDRVQEPEKMEARGSVLDRLKGKKGAIGTTETEVEAEVSTEGKARIRELNDRSHPNSDPCAVHALQAAGVLRNGEREARVEVVRQERVLRHHGPGCGGAGGRHAGAGVGVGQVR
jgi:hypothetical protein